MKSNFKNLEIRVKGGIFARVAISATINCVIYVNMRILCMFFFCLLFSC